MWLALAPLALATPAFAAEEVRTAVGPRARVEQLPRVRGELVEVVVREVARGNELGASFDSRSSQDIRGIDATYSGGGTWLLRILLEEHAGGIDASIEGEELVLRVVPQVTEIIDYRAAAPTIDELLSDEPIDIAPPPPLPFAGKMRILQGDAIAAALDPWDYEPQLVPQPPWLPKSSWESIDKAREAWYRARVEGDHDGEARARYRLGLLYQGLGFSKEARHYFSLISRKPGSISHRDLSLHAARAALGCGRWEEARELYAEAHRLGADESGVIEGLAVISLATGTPARAPTGRALAHTTGTPSALLLSAELLQRDGYYAESLVLLEELSKHSENLSADDRARAALRLGDARLMSGEMTSAIKAWRDAAPDLAAIRQQYVALLQGSTSDWAKAVPALVQASIPRTEAGAEALYLLSQIDLVIGTREDAISELSALMWRYPGKIEGSDIPEQFWRVYSSHIETLAEAEYWFDIAALHETVWHRVVKRAVKDTKPLIAVAKAYEVLGIPERAVVVLRDALGALAGAKVEDPWLILHMAELYADIDHFEDGLSTITYLREEGIIPDEARGRVAMLEARLYEGLEDYPAAARALRRAALDPAFRDAATLLLGSIDAEAGRCSSAVPSLRRLLFGPQGETVSDSRPWLALARCLTVQGDTAGAAVAAKEAAARTEIDPDVVGEQGPVERRYATWLAAVASGWSDEEMVEELVSGDDIWASMAREHKNAAEFQAEVDQRRRTDWMRK